MVIHEIENVRARLGWHKSIKKKTDAKTGNAGKIRKSERRRVGLAMTYVCDKTAEYVPSRLS